MKFKFNKYAFAKQVVALLMKGREKNPKGTYPSPFLLRECGIPAAFHNHGRAVLEELRQKGILHKDGIKTYKWRIENVPRDLESPLLGYEGDPVAKTQESMLDIQIRKRVVDYAISGDTFPMREYFKKQGLQWNAKNKEWTGTLIRIANALRSSPQLLKIENTALSPYDREVFDREVFDKLITSMREEESESPATLEEAVEEFDKAMKDKEEDDEDNTELFKILEALKKISGKIDNFEERLAEAEQARKVAINIKKPGKKDVIIEDRVHPIFEQVMFHIGLKENVMLVGPKGCGKTYICQQIAKALSLDFGALSLSGGITESKLFGRIVPNITTGKNEFHSALFLTMYEEGGLFLLDEVDAGDPNVLLSTNMALANRRISVDREKRPIATMDDDFVCIAAANTWGHGADRQYVGRNQMDSAFVERFVQIPMFYDEGLELALCPGQEDMVRRLHTFRRNIVFNKLERVVSTRFIVDRAFKWMENGKEFEYVEAMLFNGWREDEARKARG